MNRNIICLILFKDKTGVHRIIFIIEGEKPNDSSIYIVKTNYSNAESANQNNREMYLQNTYHSRIGPDGLVQTHTKRGNQHFGQTRQIPLGQRKSVICLFHSSNDVLEKYPNLTPSSQDIKININPKYFNDYQFAFYTDENEFKKFLIDKNLVCLNSFKLPINNENVYFSTVIDMNKLAQIQKK